MLIYGPPESEADFAMTCTARSGSIVVMANAPRPLSKLQLSSGGLNAVVPASSEYDGEIFEGYTVSAQLPADHRLLRAFASGRDLRTQESGPMPARTAAERAVIARFVRTCRKARHH